MKDNISIIFSALIGTILIVILPLYSILDRQDSMSYNVVLTATTNFVDTVRNNGFIDKKTYEDYIATLATTSNTYKVEIEAYQKTLIHSVDEDGKIVKDKYEEEIELYNTLDVLDVIYGNKSQDLKDTNKKSNVYLLDVDDEFYVKVYNTNITMGSIMYSFIAKGMNTKVINISYGGLVNKINWELYNKVNEESQNVPEVVLGVPTNRNGATNIFKVDTNESCEQLNEETGEYENICEDEPVTVNDRKYVYRYDLTQKEGATSDAIDNPDTEIRVSAEFKNVDYIFKNDNEAIKLSELTEKDFEDVKKYLLDVNNRKIQLNGINATIDIKWRGPNDYYMFDIILTNVRMSSLLYISDIATITLLPGIGKSEDGTLSLGSTSVELEVMNETAVHNVQITGPLIWQKILKDRKLENVGITDGTVYVNEEIAFVVEYTGINRETADIVNAIKNSLRINGNANYYKDLEVISIEDVEDRFNTTGKKIIVKFVYTKDSNEQNYISLPEGWIETDLAEIVDTDAEGFTEIARGATSSEYQVKVDNYAPVEPDIVFDGTLGQNGWYTSKVDMSIVVSTSDLVGKYDELSGREIVDIGGSGVWKNTFSISGARKMNETEYNGNATTIEENGISIIDAYAYDYAYNKSKKTKELKIDTVAPTAPTIKALEGTKGNEQWYTSNVRLQITGGEDATSGVDKTTYKIEGAGAVEETTIVSGGTCLITAEGESIVTATTYDNAGNKTEQVLKISIDKTEPKEAKISVISGTLGQNGWYTSDVTLKIEVDVGDAVSGLGASQYRILGYSDERYTFTENTCEVVLDKDGTFELIVYTYSKAGNYKQKSYTVKIDKTKPNLPTLTLDTPNDNNWYRKNVFVNVKSNDDVGLNDISSGLKEMTYVIKNKDTSNQSVEKVVRNNENIEFTDEGRFELTVYAIDNAGNRSYVKEDINIDKTNPVSAEFKINGTTGQNGWYKSDVTISYTGGSDSLSGIDYISLTQNEVTGDTNSSGVEVIMTTVDKAGNYVEKSTVIKIDKTSPTAPKINLDAPTGETITIGTLTYNKDVNVNITPGTDANYDRTTYEVTRNSNTIISETVGTDFKINFEGTMTIIARTYDKAGNVTKTEQAIIINKNKPLTPIISKINDTSVENMLTYTEVTNDNNVKITLKNVGRGKLYINLINQTTGQRKVIENIISEDVITLNITLEEKAKYGIIAVQKNLYGTSSDESSGTYYIDYR